MALAKVGLKVGLKVRLKVRLRASGRVRRAACIMHGECIHSTGNASMPRLREATLLCLGCGSLRFYA